MRRPILLFLLLAFLIAPQATEAQQKLVKDFSLMDAVSGQTISLSAYKTKKGVLLIFTSNYCPYSKLYEGRISRLEQSYPDVQVILINPNNPQASESDSFEEMQKKAKDEAYTVPYLADKDQKIATLLGASKTPEVFLLRPGANGYAVVYSGALDDNPQVENDVHESYVDMAIKELIDGVNTIKNKRPIGCMIKKY